MLQRLLLASVIRSRIHRTCGLLASQVLGEHMSFSYNTGYSNKVTLALGIDILNRHANFIYRGGFYVRE